MPACDAPACRLFDPNDVPAPDESLLHVSLSSLSDDQTKVISFLILRLNRNDVIVC